MAAPLSIPVKKKSQEVFVEYYKSLQSLQNITRAESRARFEAVDKLYYRQTDTSYDNTRAQQANRAGDPTRYRNLTVPVIKPQIETAVSYQTSVFLTGYPIFGVVSSPQNMDAALQLETILAEQSVKTGWARHLMMFFRDGFKYNFAPIECCWDKVVTPVIETDPSRTTGVTKETIWEGNSIRRLDPYNTFIDTRVLPTELHTKGEFAGSTEYMSRIELKSFISRLTNPIISNIVPAFESGNKSNANLDSGAMNYYVPDINLSVTDPKTQLDTNWLEWARLKSGHEKIHYKGAYEVTKLYCRILPSEFDLVAPNSNTPQVFKLIIVNHEHIIQVERQTNAHGFIPIFIGQPYEDGLGYQTKSLAEDGEDFQSVASTYMNSIIASRRRSISDRVLYDPSRISEAAINSPNPSAKIPVRPAAYGKPISEAVYQFPYREDQAQISMQQIQTILALSNQIAGQNQASQGQFVKGNKTLQEFESVMANANGTGQMTSILLEHQVFVPLKEVLKINILQYQGGTTLYNRDKSTEVEIDPIQLRQSVLEFKISDGLVPSSKILNTDTFSVALQVLGSSPQIAAGYNIGPLFSYIMKSQGARISDFEKSPEQVAYEQAVQSWQQVAQVAIQKGVDPSTLPPQPLPEQFGYTPAGQQQ